MALFYMTYINCAAANKYMQANHSILKINNDNILPEELLTTRAKLNSLYSLRTVHTNIGLENIDHVIHKQIETVKYYIFASYKRLKIQIFVRVNTVYNYEAYCYL